MFYVYLVTINKFQKLIGKPFRYTGEDLKICQYLCLYAKIICRRFHIYLLLFEIYAREICEKFVYKYLEIIEYVKN